MNNISEVSIIVSFGAGILSFLSPCILPLFPSYISYITGKTFEDINSAEFSSQMRKTTALHSLCFILGFSLIFIMMGVSFSLLGSFFGIKRVWIERIGGICIILFGLHISGLLKVGLLNREKKLIGNNIKKISFLGSLAVGMAFAAGWVPCVGPVLSSILIYASSFDSMPKAIVLLSSYSLGLGIPFFIGGVMVNHFLFVFKRFRAIMKFVPVITGVFLVLMGGLLFSGYYSGRDGSSVKEPAERPKTSSKAAPDFTLIDLNGRFRGLSEFKGKVIILDFWATWCPPCRMEIPHFVELYDKYKDKGLEIIGVTLDRNGEEIVPPFVEKHNINYVILLGDKQTAGLYGGINAIPTTFVIDREGNIIKKYIGYTDKEVFEDDINELL
jgi:cytochrome c-type biogenesis protein